jgi:hypothetical protein
MIELSFHRVRPEKVERLRTWLSEVMRRKDEALETFAREGTRHEVASLTMTNEGPVLVYAIERDPTIDGQKAFLTSDLPIDKEHLAVLKECLFARHDAETLLDIALPSERKIES